MSPAVIDFHQPNQAEVESADLAAHLAPVLGEPLRLVRFSYGDELAFHLGTLSPRPTKRFPDAVAGSFILGTRASHWVMRSAPERGVIVMSSEEPMTIERKQEICAAQVITLDSRVTAVVPFPIPPIAGWGLRVEFSDGGCLTVTPNPSEWADWEWFTPGGLLSVGPGLAWKFRSTSHVV